MKSAGDISIQRQLDHFNRAQRHARIGSFEHDLRSGQTFWSDEQYRLLGFEPGQVTPALDIFLALLDAPSRARFLRKVRVCSATGRDFRIDLHYTPHAGSPRVAHIRAEFEAGDDGENRIVSGTFQDVTGRRNTEKALRQSEARYRSIFDNALEGISQTTMSGAFLSANASMARILGYDSPEDLVAGVRNIDRDLYVQPEDRERYLDLLREYGSVRGFQTLMRRKDGAAIWVSLNASLILDTATGEPCLLGTVEDISRRKQFELALIESDKRFQNLLQRINVIAVSLDLESRIIFSNPFLHQLTGWSRQELEGRNWFDLLVPYDGRDAMRAALHAGNGRETEQGLDAEILTRNGERLLIRWNTVTDIDIHGEVSGITCMGVDITEIRRARDTLAASARMHFMRLRIANAMHETSGFSALMRTVQNVLCEAIEARNLIIAVVNPETKTLEFPYWVDERMDVSRAAPRIANIDDPENRRLTLELLRGNIPNILSGRAMRHLAETGRVRIVGEIPQSWMGAPLRIRGEGIGAIIVQNYATDTQYTAEDLNILLAVSEQIAMAIDHQRHDELARTAEEIFRDIPSGLFIYTFEEPDRLILDSANPAALHMTRRSLAEIKGREFTEIWTTAPRELLEEFLRCLRSGEHLDLESQFYEDGLILAYFRIRAFVLPRRKLAVAFEDVTESRRAEQAVLRARDAAESANRAKSEFLANISHEVRTPLNGIMGMLQLSLQYEMPQELGAYLRTALESSRNLLRVLNDVLDFTKVDAGKMELLEREFDLDGMLGQAVNFFKALAMDKKIALNLEKPPCLGRFIGDEGRLRQILFNLMGNALKFTDNGCVTLEAWPVGEADGTTRVLFEVRDEGIGIPADKLDYIFESFTQVDGSYSRRYQGTGLGLPIVRRLVNLMGGHISVESAENEGTSIFFVLPLRRGEGECLTEGAPLSAAPAVVRPLQVLLVEDDVVNMTMAKRMLEKMGHSVICARTGVEALDCLLVPGVDLVLMDIQMPQMDGMEATRILRTDPRFEPYARVPVIALTAHAMTGDMERFLAQGMDAYLSKPFDHSRLQELLVRFFG
jgi:PAS domain S-box-containing protein